VDEDREGKDSDHKGVQCLPRTNLAPQGGALREKIWVRRFPESKIAEFGLTLADKQWGELEDTMDATMMVDAFVNSNSKLVDKAFPQKQIQVGLGERPYFTEELRTLKRKRQRAYEQCGKKSSKYKALRQRFDIKLLNEAKKYRTKIENEVKDGKRGSGYKAIRKLGNMPREAWTRSEVTLPAYREQQLTPLQAANKLAEHFSAISQTVEPLDPSQFNPALQAALEEGRYGPKPYLSQHDVYRAMTRVTKPNSSVDGDIPSPLLKKYPYEYSLPAAKIFNKMIQSGQWPRQWVREETIVLSKLDKSKQPVNEDDLRTISKTAWLSKCAENILGGFILPVINSYLDPAQCGGLKKTSITHYLVKLLDFIHSTLDKKNPHSAVLCLEDLSKAYNRGSHLLVMEDLHAMKLSGWALNLVCSNLTERSMILTYSKARSSERSLPGGFGAGTWLGGLLFIVKFNGACLRPPIPRPISGNKGKQLKYIDDSCQMASVNLKCSLEPDLKDRPRPLNYHERNQTKIIGSQNVLQQELLRFEDFVTKNKLVINTRKCYVMLFTRSTKYSFPPEFSFSNCSILDVKKKHRILGLIIQDDLRWNCQVQQMVSRATKTTWVLRRMRALGVDQKSLVAYWKAEGRVHLEMACPVWHPGLTLAQSRDLDRAQRVAMAAITGRWEPSHSRQLLELGLEPLGPRRVKLCRSFAQRTAENSRHQDFFTHTGTRVRRGKQAKTYRETLSRTDTHYRSPLPYMTRLLNGI
jgi:hypothetical protein